MTRLRDHGLSLFFGVVFLLALAGQTVAGQRAFNAEQTEHGEAAVSWLDYVLSSHFGRAMLENWQSEYLQFFLFIYATVWLVQRGSNESKQLDRVGLETDEQQRVGAYLPPNAPRWARARGWRMHLFSNSLGIVMLAIFALSWLGQSLTGANDYNADQRAHGEPTVSWAQYLARPNFWEETLQNWQSEFLAVGSMAVFTIYLRQRGSPESKPVGAPHDETATSG